MQTFFQKKQQPSKGSSANLVQPHSAPFFQLKKPESFFQPPTAPFFQRSDKVSAEEMPASTEKQRGDKGAFIFESTGRLFHHPQAVSASSYAAAPLQLKLSINKPGDEYEQQADHIADKVIQQQDQQLQRRCECGGSCATCQVQHQQKSQGQLQPFRSTNQQSIAPPIVQEVLSSRGQAMDAPTKNFMENRFDRDFSQVQLHADSKAAQSALAVNASAYTVGRDIVFGAGKYAPGTTEGDRLLAHELTHVVQQSGGHEGQSSNGPLSISRSRTKIQRDTKDKQEPKSNLKHMGGGSKALANGVIVWAMWVLVAEEDKYRVIMHMSFTPYKKHRGKTITFLQTVQDSGTLSNEPAIDLYTYGKTVDDNIDDKTPFYGAKWDNKTRGWVGSGAVGKFKNQPGSAADPNAYFFDAPAVYPGQTKIFETAVVIPETAEVLAFINWGARGGKDRAEPIPPTTSEPSDQPSARFLVAVDRFYEKPPKVGPDTQRTQRFDAVLDQFTPDSALLTAGQKKLLDPIAKKIKDENNPEMYITLGGFADATEKNPSGISEARARAVEGYLIAQGVPKAVILMDVFGAAWARYSPNSAEARNGGNRRVQVRVHWGAKR